MKQCLIVFSRYPEPGKTKTRMISVLGAEGAAKLQRQMTEHTLRQVKQLQLILPVAIAVYFTGGSQELMAQWLGTDLTYHQQALGDLGKRMVSALAQAFAAGKTKVIIIGTDCPDLDPSILTTAFNALDQQDLVLGPAEDGGYYLIGLNNLVPELFHNINWGSDRVLTQTEAIASSLKLRVHYLPKLADVDRPQDLWIWQPYQP